MGSEQKRQFFKVIDELRCMHHLPVLLDCAGLSRAGYYKWKKATSDKAGAMDIEQHILAIHSLRSFYGYRRMTVALRREGFAVNHKRVYRLMCKLGIQSVIRTKRRYFGKSGSIVFPNLLGRDFKTLFPNRKLATHTPLHRYACENMSDRKDRREISTGKTALHKMLENKDFALTAQPRVHHSSSQVA